MYEEQDALRRKIQSNITRHGSPQSFYYRQLGVSKTTFGLWLRGERKMADHRITQLKEILKNKNRRYNYHAGRGR
jgi:hypothetical protein